MRPLSSTELLEVWEEGLGRPLIGRALRLLSVACSIPDTATLAKFSIGERDARLLQLRGWMFGDRLVNVAHCPACAQTVEWETSLSGLRLQPIQLEAPPRELQLEANGYAIRFRLPNSEDVARALHDKALREHPKKLLAGCILEAKRGQQDCRAEDLPGEIFETLDQKMAEEDPQANISILLACPACGHRWEAAFDILSYLWAEIDSWAKRLLREVYILAGAFCWAERDILNMHPRRRQLYLEMLSK